MILLDTNILSEVMRKHPHPKVQAKLGQLPAGSAAASVITLVELRYGARLHPDATRFWFKIESVILPLVQWLEVDQKVALQAGDLNAVLRQNGQTVGWNDCLIAATALVHDLTLVTRNTEHFKRMPNLAIENWFR